jgi:hypothetical protein
VCICVCADILTRKKCCDLNERRKSAWGFYEREQQKKANKKEKMVIF